MRGRPAPDSLQRDLASGALGSHLAGDRARRGLCGGWAGWVSSGGRIARAGAGLYFVVRRGSLRKWTRAGFSYQASRLSFSPPRWRVAGAIWTAPWPIAGKTIPAPRNRNASDSSNIDIAVLDTARLPNDAPSNRGFPTCRPKSDPRRGSDVHAAADSLGRDLALRGGWESSGPGLRPAAPGRRLAGLVRDSFAV